MPANEEGTINYTDGIPASGLTYIDPLLFGLDTKWGGALGTGVTITYSFPGNFAGQTSQWAANYSTDSEYLHIANLNATQGAAFGAALQAWADVANITFSQVTDSSTVGVIRVAFYTQMPGGTGGWAYLPSYGSSSGDVWLNPVPASTWTGTSLQSGGSGYETMLHEIGHALGLSHPLDQGTQAGFDSRTTIMSYNAQPQVFFREVTESTPGNFSWTYTAVNPETPMIDDIAAIQYLYGPNMTFHSGNDAYTFDPSDPFLKTIWDAGGVDTISVANFSLGCKIDLQPGHLSSIKIPSDPLPPFIPDTDTDLYDGTDNLGIAYGAVIENATGGSGNDNLTGNSVKNVLIGGGGKDTLLGLGGNDTLNGGTGNDILNGGPGNDTLVGSAGLDKLNGSTGKDIFLFNTALGASSVDTISGFSHVDDVIRLDDDIFRTLGIAPNHALTAARYKENTTGRATDADDRIIYNTANGSLYYDSDGTGPAAAVKFAVIAGHPDNLDQTDFFIVS